jgi:hypothetical protein
MLVEIAELKQQVDKLEDLVKKTDSFFHSGSWKWCILNNRETLAECQIAEAIDYDGKRTPMLPHAHLLSKETFYQVRGFTTFSDGFVLNPGEIKVINPGEIHSPSISPGGACIVIIQPVELAYAEN